MNVTITLAIVFFLLVAFIVFLVQINLILKKQNELYQLFILKSPVKVLIATLDKCSSAVINDRIQFMLEKYFKSLLTRINYRNIPDIVKDVISSKHADVLKKCLIKAAHDDFGLFGLALTETIRTPKDKEILEAFLDEFPKEERKRQYKTAWRSINDDLKNNTYNYHLKQHKPYRRALQEFKKKSL